MSTLKEYFKLKQQFQDDLVHEGTDKVIDGRRKLIRNAQDVLREHRLRQILAALRVMHEVDGPIRTS